MCEICRKYKCPSGCPNAPEPPIFAFCYECDAEIYDGDAYYEIEERKYCESCVSSSYRTAEVSYDE